MTKQKKAIKPGEIDRKYQIIIGAVVVGVTLFAFIILSIISDEKRNNSGPATFTNPQECPASTGCYTDPPTTPEAPPSSDFEVDHWELGLFGSQLGKGKTTTSELPDTVVTDELGRTFPNLEPTAPVPDTDELNRKLEAESYTRD